MNVHDFAINLAASLSNEERKAALAVLHRELVLEWARLERLNSLLGALPSVDEKVTSVVNDTRAIFSQNAERVKALAHRVAYSEAFIAVQK